MKEQEEIVNELFKDFEDLTQPTAAFVTFEEEDGRIIALKNEERGTDLLGAPMVFQATSEPTDIIWENRHFTNWDYFKRQLFAFAIIVVLLLGSFIVTYFVANYSS